MMLIILWMVGCITSFSGLALSLFMKTLSFKRMALSYSLYTLQFIRLHRRVGRFQFYFSYQPNIVFSVYFSLYKFISSHSLHETGKMEGTTI